MDQITDIVRLKRIKMTDIARLKEIKWQILHVRLKGMR